MWNKFRDVFNKWETSTAKRVEDALKNPLVLEPAGALLTTVMRTKARADRAVASVWGVVGLPTKRDQERTLHALNQIQSRLLDLEEQLAAANDRTKPNA